MGRIWTTIIHRPAPSPGDSWSPAQSHGEARATYSEGPVTHPPLPLDCLVVPPRNDSVAEQDRLEHLAY